DSVGECPPGVDADPPRWSLAAHQASTVPPSTHPYLLISGVVAGFSGAGAGAGGVVAFGGSADGVSALPTTPSRSTRVGTTLLTRSASSNFASPATPTSLPTLSLSVAVASGATYASVRVDVGSGESTRYMSGSCFPS